MNPKSRKAFVVEVVEGARRYRLPYPGTGKMFADEFFSPLEESPYLASKLGGVSYITYTTDDEDDFETVGFNGYTHTDGSRWKQFFGFWKERKGHSFMVPEAALIGNGLDFIGITAIIDEVGKITKAAKGVNRIFNPLPYGVEAIWGKELNYYPVDNMSLVRLNISGVDLTEEDKELYVKYVPLDDMTSEQKALGDGAILVSEKAVRRLGLSVIPKTGETLEVELGMAWHGVTVGTPRAFGKGHAMYVPDLEVDIVIFGPKLYIRTEDFYFGHLGALHVGDPHTDRQAFVNFGFHRSGLADDLALKFMKQVMAASKNEMELRRLFLRHAKALGVESDTVETWILEDALRYGVSYLRFPSLFRRVVNYLAGPDSKVFQCVSDARIPMDEVAQYAYVLPDPKVFDSEGGIHSEWSLIPDGYLVLPDLRSGTKVQVYRQPSETSNAHYALTIFYKPYYKGFAGRGICLLGRGADKVLQRLGGGDLDDQFMVVFDPIWVKAFEPWSESNPNGLRTYPETEKLSDSAMPDEDSLYTGEQDFFSTADEILAEIEKHRLEKQEGVPYGMKHVSWQLEMAKKNRATSLGVAVNAGMLDMLLSDPDHQQSMLEDLESREEWDAAEWLRNYEPYQFRKVMTNLERVIDGAVKDPTLRRGLDEDLGRIRQWHERCMVYPTCMASKENNKIPIYKMEMGDFVLANSLMCKCLAKIDKWRLALLKEFKLAEWRIASRADNALQTVYKRNPEVSKLVSGDKRLIGGVWTNMDPGFVDLKSLWRDEWSRVRTNNLDFRVEYPVVCEAISARVRGASTRQMRVIAAELYYRTYTKDYFIFEPGKDPVTGEVVYFRDSLLWSPVFAKHFINALRTAGLTGYYAQADIYPKYRALLHIDKTIVVKNRLIYVVDDAGTYTVNVGYIPEGKAPDGMYTMYSGLIEFLKAQPICLPHNMR